MHLFLYTGEFHANRGPMRRTVRPFIKEFKNRSAKRPANQSRSVGDAGQNGGQPSFPDLGVFATPRNNLGDEYKASWKAADAVFGGSSSTAVAPETTASFKLVVRR